MLTRQCDKLSKGENGNLANLGTEGKEKSRNHRLQQMPLTTAFAHCGACRAVAMLGGFLMTLQTQKQPEFQRDLLPAAAVPVKTHWS